MTPPRYNVEGQTVFVTVQAVGRSFRFVPTKEVRQSIDFLFALLVAKYELLVHEYLFMSDHYHFAATDPGGRISAFLQEFNSMLSRQLNALRGTVGVNFEREPGIQAIVDEPGVIQKAIYTLVNPLVAHLVARLRHWKASSSQHMEYGEPVTFTRPKCGLWAERRERRRKGRPGSRGRLRYRGRSTAPEAVTFTLARPQARMDLTSSELRKLVRGQVAAKETELIEERRATGRKVEGWLGVITRRYLEVPSTPREHFGLRPRVTGEDAGACHRMLERLEIFTRAYRVALDAFKNGARPTFPYGTLQVAQRYGLTCATAPP